MEDFEPISFRVDYNSNINVNRWDTVQIQMPDTGTVFGIPLLKKTSMPTIGELLGTQKTHPKTQATKPAKQEKAKTVETDSEPPKEPEQISKEEQARIREEETIKSLRALSDIKVLSDEDKIKFNNEISAYIDMLAKDAQFDNDYFDEIGNHIFVGRTKNGNIIEITEGKNGDSAMQVTRITTKDGTEISHIEVEDSQKYYSTVVSSSSKQDGPSNSSGIMVETDLATNTTSRISSTNTTRNPDGEIHTDSVSQLYNSDGSKGFAFMEEINCLGNGDAGGHTFTGTIDENGDFKPNGKNPSSSWERTGTTFTGFDSEGNVTIQMDLSQPQNLPEYIDEEPQETISLPPEQPQTAEVNSNDEVTEVPEEEPIQQPEDEPLIFGEISTNLLQNAEAKIKTQ